MRAISLQLQLKLHDEVRLVTKNESDSVLEPANAFRLTTKNRTSNFIRYIGLYNMTLNPVYRPELVLRIRLVFRPD